jgi:hypothetical protein
MEKLNSQLLRTRRTHLARRRFLMKLPLITAFVLASQTKTLFANSPQEDMTGSGYDDGRED